MNNRVVSFLYTNWKGVTRQRRVIPQHIEFGSNEHHKEPQWLLVALDLDKNAQRSFALNDIVDWSSETSS